MKKSLYLFFLILCFTHIKSWGQISDDYVPNEVMVMIEPGYSVKDLLASLNSQDLVGQFRLKQELSKRYRIYLLEHDAILGESKKLVYDIASMDGVAIAQLNHYIQERLVPNDPSFASQQWSMDNVGQTGGTVDADVDAPDAWNITTGGVTSDGDTIVIAVVDGGVQASHPDLQANMWKNYPELAGIAGVDDDGNGYIDDFNGWDAVGDDNTIPNNGHATHVAGILGAKGNNSTGVAGVNWNVKILNVRGSSGTESVVVLAYDYVASLRELYNNTNGALGAFVVATNNSFGVDFGQPSSYPIWCAMYDTMGVLGILSAGAGPNQNTDIDALGDIPTTCPSNYMIAVTNTTSTDVRNSSSGYGPINMDIGAPGTSIYSSYTTSTYTSLTGTSMATPHVAGAIGLYYSAACLAFIEDYKSNPGLLAQQMKTYLLAGVDSISSMATTTYSQGRLNLYKGILKVQNYNCLGLPPVANFSSTDQSICEGNTVTYIDGSTNSPTAWNWSFPGGSPSSSTLQSPAVTYLTAGVYNVQLIATNGDGTDTVLLNNYITVNANPAAPTTIDNSGTFESSYLGSGNQWYLNGSPIGGAINDTYTPMQGGAYYVVYTDVNGCSSTSSSLISTIGLDDENMISILIYPNPVSEKLIIDAGINIQATVKILDISGRNVMILQMNQSLINIDLSQISAGIYIVKLEFSDKSVTKKIVKQ